MNDPVFCQNCGRRCDRVYEGSNGLHYCSRDCEMTGRLIAKYEWPILLTICMLFLAMIMTAQYMIDKYSQTTQEQDDEQR